MSYKSIPFVFASLSINFYAMFITRTNHNNQRKRLLNHKSNQLQGITTNQELAKASVTATGWLMGSQLPDQPNFEMALTITAQMCLNVANMCILLYSPNVFECGQLYVCYIREDTLEGLSPINVAKNRTHTLLQICCKNVVLY